MRPFTFHRSTSIDDALTQVEPGAGAEFVAGGTTLIDLVKLDVMRPQHVIDINELPLTAVEHLPDGGLRIGALVRNSDLAWHGDVKTRYPVLSAALLSGASPQLRNMATTGGNVMQRTRCPYFRDNVSSCNKREPGSGCAAMDGYNRSHAILGVSDACIATHPSYMCVALAALDATLILRSPAGERALPFAEFHRLPGATPHLEHALRDRELIVAVVLPPPMPGAFSRYVKLRDRESFEFALASVAAVLSFENERVRDVRIALGGVATKPWRSLDAELALRGQRVSRATFEAAANAALRDAQPREYNAFKLPLARQAIVRALEELSATAGFRP